MITKIHELVMSGVSESIEMKHHLKYYVINCLCKDRPPNPNDRAYFPTLGDIRNHMNQAQKTLKLSLVDQENVALKVAEYHKLSSETKIHFQPFTKSDENESSTELLWVHQEPWQQELLIKYDATYKTTKYDLPLRYALILATVLLLSSSYRVRIDCTLRMRLQLSRLGIHSGSLSIS